MDCIAFGVCIGMMFGVALGCWMDDLGLWMCVCLAVGICVGAAIDLVKK